MKTYSTFERSLDKLFCLIKIVFLEPMNKLALLSKENLFFWSIILIAIISRLYFIYDPIRIDEAATFLQYIKGNPLRVFYYSSVNNHIFFTLLVKISTFFTGTSPATLRIISFLSGIISIILTYILCKEFKQKGLYAAIAMSITPYLIFYSTYARSYTLNLCISLSLCLLAKSFLENKSNIAIFAISILSGIGLLTVPTMILNITGIYIWIYINLIKGKGLKDAFLMYLLPIGCLTIICTFIFYLPVILLSGGISSITNAKFTESIGLIPTLQGMPSYLTSTLLELTNQIPKPFLILNTIFFVLGIVSYFQKNSFKELTLVPSLMIGGFITLIARSVIGHERSFIYLIPFILVVSDQGFTFLTRNLSKNIFRNFVILILFLGLIFSRNIHEENLIDNVPLSKIFPEAPRIIKYLEENNIGEPEEFNININETFEPNLQFYSWYYNYPIYVNGISFKKSNSYYEWIKQAKLDFAKFQNKSLTRNNIRLQNTINKNQIYIKLEDYPNYLSHQKAYFKTPEKLVNVAEFGNVTIFKENN